MAAAYSTPEGTFTDPDTSSAAPQKQTSRAQRVLACVLCAQRKVKCDRKFPCSNCIKARAQCVPSTLTARRRRRRFPEQQLLERLHRYENLLRQHNIDFDPISKDLGGGKGPFVVEGGDDSDHEPSEAAAADWPSPSSTVKSERVYGTKYVLVSKMIYAC